MARNARAADDGRQDSRAPRDIGRTLRATTSPRRSTSRPPGGFTLADLIGFTGYGLTEIAGPGGGAPQP